MLDAAGLGVGLLDLRAAAVAQLSIRATVDERDSASLVMVFILGLRFTVILIFSDGERMDVTENLQARGLWHMILKIL